MIQKIKNTMVVLATLLMAAIPALVPVAVHAASISGALCQGTGAATEGAAATEAGCDTSSGSADSLYALAAQIVNIFSVIVGIIAVIMIIFGGFKYITSGGDSGNVSGAKNTLIYAIVGLIVVALAQFIVRFVLTQANTITP